MPVLPIEMSARRRAMGEDVRCLEIGLVNNMPDAALKSTERQFLRLLQAAASSHVVRVHFYTIPAIERGAAIRPHLDHYYASTSALPSDDLDAVIVTGTEPRRTDLREEPYWPALAKLFDGARDAAVPLLASCLAAHAAAFHYDGVIRRRRVEKCFGVYAHRRLRDHPLTRGVPDGYRAPHSRWNELSADDLTQAGYAVLTASDLAGVDIFVRRGRHLVVGIQAHPEYGRETLLREYARDINRCLAMTPRRIPPLPAGYFDAVGTCRLDAHVAGIGADATSIELPEVAEHITPDWSASAASVIRNWLDLVAERRAGRVVRQRNTTTYASSARTF
jgi:homoserine O-succinyltransferase